MKRLLHQKQPKSIYFGLGCFYSRPKGLRMASIRRANCMELPLGTYGITACRVFPFLSVLIPYNAIGIDSILADARFHTRLWRDLVQGDNDGET